MHDIRRCDITCWMLNLSGFWFLNVSSSKDGHWMYLTKKPAYYHTIGSYFYLLSTLNIIVQLVVISFSVLFGLLRSDSAAKLRILGDFKGFLVFFCSRSATYTQLCSEQIFIFSIFPSWLGFACSKSFKPCLNKLCKNSGAILSMKILKRIIVKIYQTLKLIEPSSKDIWIVRSVIERSGILLNYFYK